MATGTIECAAPIAGLRLAPPLELSSPVPAIEKITLETQDDERLRTEFHLTNVYDFEEATGIAKDVLPSLIDTLAFYTNSPIGEPRITGGTLPKDASGSSYAVRMNLTLLWAQASLPHFTLDDDKRQELATLLEQPYTSNYLYSAYRFAINQQDPVSRYMFLYNILLELNDDKQRRVDDYIRSEVPGVPETLSPKNKMETVYTRLRNEVGHARPRTTPEDTRRAIEDNVDVFQELVREAIPVA